MQARGNNEICIVENDLFKMVFDMPTPRPHFIILFKKPQNRSINDFDESEINKLLALIEQYKTKHELTAQSFILSFHTGFWVIIKVAIVLMYHIGVTNPIGNLVLDQKPEFLRHRQISIRIIEMAHRSVIYRHFSKNDYSNERHQITIFSVCDKK